MADRYRMTGHKLHWHPDRVGPWLEGKRIAPLHIELGLTNACQLDCRYCYGDIIGRVCTGSKSRFDLPRDVIFSLFKDAREIGVKSVTLIGEGENTISPHFYHSLSCAREVGLDLALATNGLALKETKIADLLRSLVWIRFSLGAAGRWSYLEVHGHDKFDAVVKNIALCVREKRASELQTTLGIQMVVIHQNIPDIVPLAELAKSLGVDYFVVKPCSESPDKRLNVKPEEYLELRETFQVAEALAELRVFDVVIKREKFGNLGVNDFQTCYGTAFTIAIDAHGDVVPCGHLLSRKREFKLGNIVDQSLREIVESDRYWDIQKKVQKLDVNSECETNCLHHDMNLYLEMLRHPPAHLNFP